MELKISDLPPQFEDIARELGIERAKLLLAFIAHFRKKSPKFVQHKYW